jgi:hypothetical protein
MPQQAPPRFIEALDAVKTAIQIAGLYVLLAAEAVIGLFILLLCWRLIRLILR